ncbi:MAG TPA: ABC transporter transmembrane domain-containing protein [Spirillospora sp.]|nr:ABC transporter transmembrane domain-containing protein [Spirillospora sp.]
MFGRRLSRPTSNKDRDSEIPEGPVQWRRLVGYLKPYKARLGLALIGLLLSAATSLVFPAVISTVVDSVLVAGDADLLNRVTLALILVFLLSSVASLIERYNLFFIGEKIVVDVRTQLYDHLQTLSLGFFVNRRVGELISRLSSDVTTMRNVLTGNISTLLQQSVIMTGAIIIMLLINWRMSLFILGMIPIIGLLGVAFGALLRRISTQIQDELAEATTVADEVLQNIREVKSFGREQYEIRRYRQAIERSFRAAVRLLRVRTVFGPMVAFLGFGGLALVLWFGGQEVLAGRLTGGELIGFLIYGMTVGMSFGALTNLYTSFQEALGATKRVFQLLDEQPGVQDAPDAKVLDSVAGRITFEGVHFRYEDRQEVLHDINLDIAPGEIIALVGPSGAGKSTIFNLIPRFYDVTEGRLCIDGHDVRHVTQASLRAQIGIVPQETLLFGGTIRENIRYGRLDASDAEIVEAARAANAYEFIMSLPDQYETIVGERGVRLSGGQRQRVAIARAVLKNPRILLLDEATSSLDSESEHLVQEALARLMQNRTTVIIAHRLSTVKVAHRIAVLDGGHLVEVGTHDELMARDGLYARLYTFQFRPETDLLAADGGN